jgi:glycosyltransferase involved in cell wall biosynthesis
MRLGILSTHPIQYHSPWFRALAEHDGTDLEVLFCHQATAKEQSAAGFGVEFDWDISLLDGYSYRFLKNVSKHPGLVGFRGLDTPEIARIVAEKRFDVIIANGWHYKSAWQTMRACWNTGTPIMVRSDSHLHTIRSKFKQVGKWPFYHWFISKLDGCVAVGKWSSDYFLHYGAAPERVFTVPHVVDTNYFENEVLRLTPERDAIRARWGIDSSAVVFLFAGKFTEIKRPLDFVNAIAHANRNDVNIVGLMVGDGPLRAACEISVKKNNLPVKFAGFLNQSRMTEAYVAADALVVPSTAETWGLVVNEAMACGRPCFVSDAVGCGPDMVMFGRTGATFAPGDTYGLGKILVDFAVRKDFGFMRQAILEKANEYSLKTAVERTVMAMEAVTG